MTSAGRTLIAGIGSSHGDDQAGWLVARELQRRLGNAVDVQLFSSPIDLLSHLEGVGLLILVDACQGSGPVGTCHCWQWPELPVSATRSGGTHQFELSEVLKLAQQLADLPAAIQIWGIEGSDFRSGAPVSMSLKNRISEIATAIAVAIPR